MMKLTRLVAGILALIGLLSVLAISQTDKEKLRLITCDVGEGDAILAVMGQTEILIDGGPPNNLVLDCLSTYLPFYDREIELVVLTHGDLDHFGGLIEVFKRYKVDSYLVNKADSGGLEYQVLKNAVGGSGASVIYPQRGMTIRLGLIYLDILNPDGNDIPVDTSQNGDTNDASIVIDLRLGKFDALLTGDIGPKGTEELIKYALVGDVDYIKIPHHGSKNGLTESLLLASKPELAVISVGKNFYGHPHQETLDLLRRYNLKTLRTDEEGNIEIVTDGERWWTN